MNPASGTSRLTNRETDMRTFAALTIVAILAGTIGVALAQDGPPQSHKAVSIEAMKQKIDALGYDVSRLKVDDGVFKAKIVERQSGGVVKATFDLGTGELVRAKLAS